MKLNCTVLYFENFICMFVGINAARDLDGRLCGFSVLLFLLFSFLFVHSLYVHTYINFFGPRIIFVIPARPLLFLYQIEPENESLRTFLIQISRINLAVVTFTLYYPCRHQASSPSRSMCLLFHPRLFVCFAQTSIYVYAMNAFDTCTYLRFQQQEIYENKNCHACNVPISQKQ